MPKHDAFSAKTAESIGRAYTGLFSYMSVAWKTLNSEFVYSSPRKQSGYEQESKILAVQKELRSFLYYFLGNYL